MQGLVEFLENGSVVAFILLFFRFGGLFISAPIFSHATIPIKLKASMAFFFTIVFYASLPPLEVELNVASVVLAILSEMLFGLVIGLALQIAYNVITFAGGIISYMMGFSMATAIDPQNGVSMPIVSQFLSLIALMILFTLNLHHWLILYINESLTHVPLGGFLLTHDIIHYTIYASKDMFLVGFMIAFPIVALILLSDVIFGMIMKTMPQFNLLVIGFPIKIGISFVVLIAIIASAMSIFKAEILQSFNNLEMFF